ncbi:hypothetical protein GCM10020331_068300 [Ectobacillus funiculus]
MATRISEMIGDGMDEQTVETVAYQFVDPLSRIIVVKNGKAASYSPEEKGTCKSYGGGFKKPTPIW